ncbi:Uncharacterized protein TCM_005767 [Theobroma cacao]|uniref:Uncharacterized protein n=1 Tax=Theobroma cacao TaxID=3641 RepID=A0A061DUY0_THECC|nr:Uncharacterized protein TCM_005767 [Theobroma cacao]
MTWVTMGSTISVKFVAALPWFLPTLYFPLVTDSPRISSIAGVFNQIINTQINLRPFGMHPPSNAHFSKLKHLAAVPTLTLEHHVASCNPNRQSRSGKPKLYLSRSLSKSREGTPWITKRGLRPEIPCLPSRNTPSKKPLIVPSLIWQGKRWSVSRISFSVISVICFDWEAVCLLVLLLVMAMTVVFDYPWVPRLGEGGVKTGLMMMNSD